MLPCQQMNLEREIELAREVAKRSAELALRLQSAGLCAEAKADESPVTNADRECEKLICAAIEEAFPDDGLLGEEGSRKASRSGRRWIIDPIDGTRDFVRNNPLWSVLIGLEAEGEVVAGVAHLPLLHQTCWASRGNGAFRNDVRLRVSPIAKTSEAVLSVNAVTRLSGMPISSGLLEWVAKFWAYRCLGGTPDAIMLAAGELDLWIEPKVAEWDLAATQVILEESGAVFFDLRGQRTIYGGSAVACTPGLEREVRAFLKV